MCHPLCITYLIYTYFTYRQTNLPFNYKVAKNDKKGSKQQKQKHDIMKIFDKTLIFSDNIKEAVSHDQISIQIYLYIR